jgi:hypothetical protein
VSCAAVCCQVLIDATMSFDIDRDDVYSAPMNSTNSKLHFYFCLLSTPSTADTGVTDVES